jgi:hypothetical protein
VDEAQICAYLFSEYFIGLVGRPQHPPPRPRAEARMAMQKWLSADELVLNAMREAHPRVIPMLVDCILNLAGNIPRPPIRLVSKQDEE